MITTVRSWKITAGNKEIDVLDFEIDVIPNATTPPTKLKHLNRYIRETQNVVITGTFELPSIYHVPTGPVVEADPSK